MKVAHAGTRWCTNMTLFSGKRPGCFKTRMLEVSGLGFAKLQMCKTAANCHSGIAVAIYRHSQGFPGRFPKAWPKQNDVSPVVKQQGVRMNVGITDLTFFL